MTARSIADILELELKQHMMGEANSNEPESLRKAIKYTLTCLTPDFFFKNRTESNFHLV